MDFYYLEFVWFIFVQCLQQYQTSIILAKIAKKKNNLHYIDFTLCSKSLKNYNHAPTAALKKVAPRFRTMFFFLGG